MTKSRNRSKQRTPKFGLTGGSSYANGGTGGGGADWVLKNFGTADQQWWNTFGKTSLGVNTGNLLPTIQGAPAVLPGMTPQGVNPPNQLFNFFKGGKGRRGRKGSKRGGMGILTEAAVPLALLAMQQSYGTRRKRLPLRKTRSRRRR